MEFEEYQTKAKRTYPFGQSKEGNMANFALGLVSEAAEVSDEVKKILFHGHELNKEDLIDEMGDQLWYMAMMCELLGVRLSEVAEYNVKKLNKRYKNGFSEEASRNRDENY